MKKTSLALIWFCLASSTMAVEKAELDNRIRALGVKLEAMQQKPDKSIAGENLRKAQGLILLDRTKAGFVFAYKGGSGVALVKDQKTGQWSPAAFLAANEGSLGFQIGGEQSFVVILLMTTNAVQSLTEPRFDFGGEASGTAGDQSAGVGGTVSSAEPPILVYDDRKGLFGGAAIKGGAIGPDEKANSVYYGRFVSMTEILFQNKVKSTEATQELVSKLNGYCRVAKN
jgi:lipid-binding SYLF domain-containing protein